MAKDVEADGERQKLTYALETLVADGMGFEKLILQGDLYFRREESEHGRPLPTRITHGGAYAFDPNCEARLEFRASIEKLIWELSTFSHSPNTDGLLAISRSLERGNVHKAFEQWEPVVLELRKWHSKLKGSICNQLRKTDLTQQVKPKARERGRPLHYKVSEDKTLVKLWQSGDYKTYEECALAASVNGKSYTGKYVELAVQRERARKHRRR